MKFLTLLLAFFAVAQAKPAFTTSKNVLQVRGGASLGPFDADLAAKCSDTALALYLGSSASKFIAGQTGGSAPGLADLFTNELVTTLALISAIANGAYFLSDTGFDSAKSVVVLLGVALALKANDAGGPDKIIDVVKANPLLSAIFALKLYIAYF